MGDNIQISGSAGNLIEAVLHLEHDIELQYVQPGFFSFEGLPEEGASGELISFSIEILQQHDASLEMADPLDSESMSHEVGVPFNSVLKMRNSGNGDDEYALYWTAVYEDDGALPTSKFQQPFNPHPCLQGTADCTHLHNSGRGDAGPTPDPHNCHNGVNLGWDYLRFRDLQHLSPTR